MGDSFLPSPLKKRVNSDLESKDATRSIFLAGNLFEKFYDESQEEEELVDDKIEEATQLGSDNKIEAGDFEKAEKILCLVRMEY